MTTALKGVPEFPEFRPIDLNDRPMVEELFLRYPTQLSERTFGSVFIWREYEHRSELSQIDGHLAISWFRARFGRTMLPPVGPDPVDTVMKLSSDDYLRIHSFVGVHGLENPEVGLLMEKGKTPESLRDEWDYVYLTDDLVRLEGPRYHTQRKELKKATAEFELVYEPMTKEHQKDCLQLEETWCDMKHCSLDKLSAAEDHALMEALERMEVLGFFGAVVLIDDRIQALTIGERLNRNTAVVHFEKANPSIRGLYQFVNQQFCEHALVGFEFVNREQDVGEPGLRRAKEGYHPHHFVEKHILLFRQDRRQ